MKPKLNRALRVVASIGCLGLAFLAASASAQQDPAASVEEVVDVTVFNLEVIVTDRKGQPVRGLTAADFAVTSADSKKKIRPSYFAEVGGDDTPSEPASVVIFVDDQHLRPSNRRRVLREIASDVGRLVDQAQLRAMVIVNDGDFRVVQELTHDSGAIVAALEELIAEEGGGSPLESLHSGTRLSIRTVLEQARSTVGSDQVALQAQFEGLTGEFRTYGRTVNQDVEQTLEALRSLVWSLAQIRGRKAVIYLSDGLAMRPLDSLLITIQSLLRGTARGADPVASQGGGGLSREASGGGSIGDTSTATARSGVVFSRDASMTLGRFQQAVEPFNSTQSLRRLIGEANSYRVTFYPVKAPPGSVMSADASGKGMTGLELSNLRESLNMLAEGTGGQAHTTETDVTGFVSELRSDFSHYYSLGITPDEGRPLGAYSELAVKVKRRGSRVRYRDGYLKKTRESQLAESTLGSLLVGRDVNNHLLEVSSRSTAPAAGGRVDVTLDVDVPIMLVGLDELTEGIHRAEARLAVVVLSSESEMLVTSQLELPLQVPAADLAAARKSYYKASLGLRLPPGRHRLGVGLWDQVRQLGTFVHQELVVPPAD